MPRRLHLVLLLLAVGTASLGTGPASAATIRVQSTTDTIDAGLVDGLLKQAYAAAQPGDTLQYVGVGTGKALDNAKQGIADVVITHAPSLEQQFVDQGFSAEPFGRAIFSSDYVLVGPTDDPAGVTGNAGHDAITALEDIAAAGAAGHASFVSRGDNSGTNVQEQLMWGLTSALPAVQHASNGGSDANREEPGSGGTYPDWYGKTGKGQAANLQEASVCNSDTYPGRACYTMVDRGTWARIHAQGLIDNLKIVSEHNAATARGSENLLINPFHAYIVNPTAVPSGSGVDVEAATRFVDFLTSPGFQAAVAGFPSAEDPAFRPDAFPLITVSTPPPATAGAGTTITLGVNVDNRLPGGGAVAGIPVQLQQSTDGGATWTDVEHPKPADDVGHVVFSAPVTASARYAVTTQRYRDLSPAGAALGAVVVPPATGPKPEGSGGPVLSRVRLQRRALTLTISEPARVRATIERRTTRRVKGRTRTRYVAVKHVTAPATRAGRVTLRWKHAIPRGLYRVKLTAKDRSGAVGTGTLGLRAT